MPHQWLSGLILMITLIISLAACDKNPTTMRRAPPIPEVTVVVANEQSVPRTKELVGRLASTRSVQVRARVAGIILKQVYEEGTDVRKGQILFKIDPEPMQTALHAKQAALAKAQADAKNAALTAKRYRELAAQNLLSTQDLDSALAAEGSTAAAVRLAKADVESAKLDLGYATVTAPIAGRAGRALVTEGALVGQGEATQLTTIEQVDPIYVNFSQSVSELNELQKISLPKDPVKVELMLPDETVYPHPGRLDFSDLAVDPETGAISLRAILPNPERRLLPGMFVNLRLTMGNIEHAFLLPQTAVLRDNQGAYAFVVDKKNKVLMRRLKTHGMTLSEWIVTGELKNTERVISEGVQKVRAGVTAKTSTPAAIAKS